MYSVHCTQQMIPRRTADGGLIKRLVESNLCTQVGGMYGKEALEEHHATRCLTQVNVIVRN